MVEGPAGSGRTTFARHIVGRLGFETKVLGALDYADLKRLRRTVRAVGCGGGLLVQMGHDRGTGLVFDELERVSNTVAGIITRRRTSRVRGCSSCMSCRRPRPSWGSDACCEP